MIQFDPDEDDTDAGFDTYCLVLDPPRLRLCSGATINLKSVTFLHSYFSGLLEIRRWLHSPCLTRRGRHRRCHTRRAAAMRAGLIDEYAIVTHPVLVGGSTRSSQPWTTG